MPEITDTDTTDTPVVDGAGDTEAWEQTIEDMHGLAARREEKGWETICISAGDTATEPPGVGPDDRYGLVHVIPGNKADAFKSVFDQGSFERYDVYRAATASRVFLVTELIDASTETTIFIAGTFAMRDAQSLIETVHETEQMYTHVQKLDGTHLGSFEHDGYEKFFPEADRIVESTGDTS